MWRWLILALLVVAISGAAAWFNLSTPVDGSPGVVALPVAEARPARDTGPPPKVVVDEPLVYEFGNMAQLTDGRHEWMIKNEGTGVLKLTGREPSCSCTVVDPKPNETVTVPPGGTYTIKIKWETRTTQGKYEKSASVLTNDPARPELAFTVRGNVQPAITTVPPEGILEAANIPNDQPHTLNAVISSADRPELKVLSLTTTRPDLIEAKEMPLTTEELAHFRLESGYRILVTIKPNPSIGPFHEEVVIKTDHPLRPEVRLTVAGKTVGPISFVPPQVRLMDVTSNGKHETSLMIWARGASETHFTLAEHPKNLKVSIVPVDDKGKDVDASRGRAYRMHVSVLPGATPGIIDDPIVLKTDHPAAGEVKIPVYIQVLGEAGED